MELWFIMAIIVAFFWGSANIFAKVSTPKIGVARVALLIALVEAPMYFVAFYFWKDDTPITLADGILAAFSCLIGVMGYICFFESVIDGQVSIVGTISAAYPALTVVGALILLSESLNAIESVGIVAIIAGVIALSYEPNPESKHAMSKRSLVFSFLAFGFWGLWSLTSKMAIDRIGAGNIFVFYILSSLTAPLMYGWLRSVRPERHRAASPSRYFWFLGAVALVLNVSGAIVYSFALGEGAASLVVPISSSYPLITIVLALVLLREKLTGFHVAALGVVVMGLIAIGLTV